MTDESKSDDRPDPLSDAVVLQRYRRFMADAEPAHKALLDEAVEGYAAFGLKSIGGQDFAELEKVWKKDPPEVGLMLSNVNTFWGSLIGSRKEPIFPGFDTNPEDSVLGEMLNLIIKAARRWAGSDAVDEQALTDLIITGNAFVEQYLETECRPPFKPRERYIPLSDIWWDAGANEKNRTDAQEFARRHRWGIDEAAARLPAHADEIRAMSRELGGTGSAASAPGEGARSLGGPAVSVSVTAADGRRESGASYRRLREVAVDDFTFQQWEHLVAWDRPSDGKRVETTPEAFAEAMDAAEQQAVATGQPFQRPSALPYAQATWYRAQIMVRGPSGGPLVVKSAAPIPGNRRLIRGMTGYPEQFLDGDTLRVRYFGFSRVLLGLQRLVSVAIRIYIEQEARHNRGGADVEEGVFPSQAALQAYTDSRAVPGAVATIPAGAFDKIHERTASQTPHVNSMQAMFKFLSVDLVAHMLGISDLNRGTFTEDRSAKFISTMLESSIQMQSRLTSSYTDYLAEGAVTMSRLLLDGFDAKDIDRLIGAQPLREGITGQRDADGNLTPILVPDPATGEQVPLSTGLYLKLNAGEIFDNDVGFGLRPAEASERMAIAGLWTQHGIIEQLAKLGLPGSIIVPAFLRVFGEDSILADAAEKAKLFYQQQEEQQKQQAEAATEQGVVGFMSNLAKTDFEKATDLMQALSDAVLGPQSGEPPQAQQQVQ